MLNAICRFLTMLTAWVFAAWLFNSFDLLRGIPLTSVDIRAEQAMVAWPSIVLGLLLAGRRSSDAFWLFTMTSVLVGFGLYAQASLRFAVINPAEALLWMLASGSIAAAFASKAAYPVTTNEPR